MNRPAHPFVSLFAAIAVLPLAGTAQEGPPGGGFPGGPGGPGGMNQSIEVKAQFDQDKNGRLDAAERKAARAWLKENRPQRGRRGPGGMGGPGGGPGGFGPGSEGAAAANTGDKQGGKLAPADVKNLADVPLWSPDVVRTFFFEFDDADWFAELSDFYRTDVQVPAKVTVDGVVYRDVGVGFRGNTSFMMAPGRKKSLDLAFDFADPKQSLQGVRNLDLLNANADASMVREMLHGWLANQFAPAQRTALVRVVINGEDHGVYVGAQQFDKEFVVDHFDSKQGWRFKVPPDFSGNGALRYLGDEIAAYKRSYELKGKDDEKAWQGLVDLCTALENAPTDRLEAILPQHLDVDGALWFLALDNAFGDDDGYHSRGSDYLLYRDPKGRFHVLPRDNNEILLAPRGRGQGGPGGGPGGGGRRPEGRPEGAPEGRPENGGAPPGGAPSGPPGGPGGRRMGPGGGAASSPLQMANRTDRPLLRRLMEVPAWKERYLANLRTIAHALDEASIGPRLAAWHDLLAPLVAVDAHSLYGREAFEKAFARDDAGKPAAGSLLAVIAQRRKVLLDDAAMAGAWPEVHDAKATAAVGNDGHFTLQITARAGKDAQQVRLWADRGDFGSYAMVAMLDDGKHGDGGANDGVFGASLPPVEGKTHWRWWVEVVGASGHVATAPAGNGALPFVWQAPNNRKPK